MSQAEDDRVEAGDAMAMEGLGNGRGGGDGTSIDGSGICVRGALLF